MQLISLASIGFVLFAVVGAVPSPVENNGLDINDINDVNDFNDFNDINDINDDLEVRDESAIQIKYNGVCSKKNNSCKYKGPNGRSAFCHCKFKKCGKDNNKCHFDSYSRDCRCV